MPARGLCRIDDLKPQVLVETVSDMRLVKCAVATTVAADWSPHTDGVIISQSEDEDRARPSLSLHGVRSILVSRPRNA